MAFISYVSTVRGNLSKRLLDRYYEIIKIALENPTFVDPSFTREFETKFPSLPERLAYESFARLCWSHARDIYDAHFLFVFFRRHFIRQYCNAFENYRNLHQQWLEWNRSFIPRSDFHRFVEKCRWRDYVSPRTADELRWGYAQNVFLDPLSATPDRIGAYIDQVPIDARPNMTVGDLGCGTGHLAERLATAGFGRVIAVDFSRKMLGAAEDRLRRYSNIEYKQLDLRDLREIYGELDLAFSTNSVVPREPSDTLRILREMRSSLRLYGELIAILPSYDTVVELKRNEGRLFTALEQARRPGRTWVAAFIRGRFNRWKAYRLEHRMSGWFGDSVGQFAFARFLFRKLTAHPIGAALFADDHANVQHFVRRADFPELLQKSHLTVIVGPERVNYSWTEAIANGYGNFRRRVYEDATPPIDPVFDWFLVASAR